MAFFDNGLVQGAILLLLGGVVTYLNKYLFVKPRIEIEVQFTDISYIAENVSSSYNHYEQILSPNKVPWDTIITRDILVTITNNSEVRAYNPKIQTPRKQSEIKGLLKFNDLKSIEPHLSFTLECKHVKFQSISIDEQNRGIRATDDLFIPEELKNLIIMVKCQNKNGVSFYTVYQKGRELSRHFLKPNIESKSAGSIWCKRPYHFPKRIYKILKGAVKREKN